jgi:hypothetical protein
MKPYLIHRPTRSTGLKTRDGKHIVEMKNSRVDEFWILKNYGREILDKLNREGKWEPENKEVIIVKLELKEAKSDTP